MGLPSNGKVVDELPALLRYARALTGDDASAEDLVHEALVAAYENSASFRRGRSLRQWLFAILHNRFVDNWRRQRRESQGAADLHSLAAQPDDIPQEQALRLQQIEAALDTLPVEQREALHLIVVEGLSYQAAAALLDVPVGTIMSRLSRARQRLREIESDPSAQPRPRLRVIDSERP